MKNLSVIYKINKLAKQVKVFYVGGFVRDFLLKKPSKDIDLEVYGVSLEKLEVLLKKIFGSHQVKPIGKSFNVLHVALNGGHNLDVSLPRRDSKIGHGHRGIKTEADLNLSMKEAARRRDFSINAMFMDPLTGEIFDFFGGQADLKSKVLRVVDAKTFTEDPLRALRAAQFASRFGLTIETKTFRLIKKMVATRALSELSSERICEELNKLLLKSEQPSYGLELLKQLGILKEIFSEFLKLASCSQEPAWHPEGSVWEHTKLVVDVAAKLSRQQKFTDEERLIILLSALCHDLGKAQTTKKINGRIRARGHVEVGFNLTRFFLRKLRYSNKIIKMVSTVALEHRWPPRLLKILKNKEIDQRRYVGEIADLLRRLGPVSLEIFLVVCEADYRGKKLKGPFFPGQKLRQTIKKYKLNSRPLVLGRDVLRVWQGPNKKRSLDGRIIGRLLKIIEENQRSGKILTKKEALKFLKKEIKKIS